MGAMLRRKEVASFALQQLDCIERKMPWCTVLLKDKIVVNYALTFVEILSYPSNAVR